MKVISHEQVQQCLNFEDLVETLKEGFSKPATMPKRLVFPLDASPNNHDAFAVLPAWNEAVIGVKSFTYFPQNSEQGFDSLYSKIMLFSRENGVPLALVDGTSVTYWRTAAISALASKLLSKVQAKTLVLFGSGNLAPYLIRAHLSVRAFEKITIVARNLDKALSLCDFVKREFPNVSIECCDKASKTLIAQADVICTATGSHQPLFNGEWLKLGTHVDLLGNHHQDARECDSATITRGKVFVDSRANVLNEAGELLIPIQEGTFSEDGVLAELSELCKKPFQRDENDITIFKSVGTALADLITAHHVYKAC